MGLVQEATLQGRRVCVWPSWVDGVVCNIWQHRDAGEGNTWTDHFVEVVFLDELVEGRFSNATWQAKHYVQDGFFPRCCSLSDLFMGSVFVICLCDLFMHKNQMLLARWDSLLVLNLGFNVLDGVRGSRARTLITWFCPSGSHRDLPLYISQLAAIEQKELKLQSFFTHMFCILYSPLGRITIVKREARKENLQTED